jgi:PilZ domain
MDRRLQDRIPARLDVRVTQLQTGKSVEGSVLDVSEGGVCLQVDYQLAPCDLVRLEIADTTVFGEVAWVAEDECPVRIGVTVFRVLLGTSDLSHLVEAILLETMPSTPGLTTAAVPE